MHFRPFYSLIHYCSHTLPSLFFSSLRFSVLPTSKVPFFLLVRPLLTLPFRPSFLCAFVSKFLIHPHSFFSALSIFFLSLSFFFCYSFSPYLYIKFYLPYLSAVSIYLVFRSLYTSVITFFLPFFFSTFTVPILSFFSLICFISTFTLSFD